MATRDLEPLEIIMEDHPAIFGPTNHNTDPVCLDCLTPIDGTYLCSKCHLPLCSSKCESGKHHQIECQIFSEPLTSGYKFEFSFEEQKYVKFPIFKRGFINSGFFFFCAIFQGMKYLWWSTKRG